MVDGVGPKYTCNLHLYNFLKVCDATFGISREKVNINTQI